MTDITELKTLLHQTPNAKPYAYLLELAQNIINQGEEDAILYELSLLSQMCFDIENAFWYLKRFVEQHKNNPGLYFPGLMELVMNANRSGLMADAEYITAIQAIYRHLIPEAVNTFAHRNTNLLRKIRVGLISYDFHSHSVGKFICALFAAVTDNSGVQILCYYTNTVKDEITDMIAAYANGFQDVSALSDAELGEVLLNGQLDIIIDLNNQTHGTRLPLLRRRFAPVQMTWMGRPSTTATPNIDYNIGDALLDSPGRMGDLETAGPDMGTERFLTEKAIHMNPSYMCYGLSYPFLPDVAEPPFLRNGYVTFGNITYPTKHSAKTLELWKAVLDAVPGAKLYLKLNILDETIMEKYMERLRRCGIDTNRVIITRYGNMAEYFNAYNEIDILLDTTPYNGCTTLVESFLMGTPTVSLKGAYRQGRHCLFLTHVGLGDLIAETPAEYAQKAATLANNPERIARIKKTLRATAKQSVLFDPAAFRTAFEKMTRTAYLRYCGEKKEPFNGSIYENNADTLINDCLRAPRMLAYAAEEGRPFEYLQAMAAEYLEMCKILLTHMLDEHGETEAIGNAIALLPSLGAAENAQGIIAVMSAVNRYISPPPRS